MPELPEVETTIKILKNKVLNRTFVDIWTDSPKLIKKPANFKEFKKLIKGKEIKNIWRRAKNIIFELSGGYSLLVHLKMTGHLLIGNWKATLRGLKGKPSPKASREINPSGSPFRVQGNWEPLSKGPLEESVNRYIHIMLWLSGDLMLALSDLRKFAKVELWKTKELLNSKEFKKLGPEPLDKNFTFEKFKETFQRTQGKIKQVLMNQEIIAGIGNIYSDEALWRAKINPLKDISNLNESELKKLYTAIQEVLKMAIKLSGESFSDYRTPEGKKGDFDAERRVYRREGEKCSRCGTIIKRLKIGGRSAHFCPKCQ